MSKYSKENYEIEYYRTSSSDTNQTDHFAPSIESLKSAQDIIRRYEKERRAATKPNRRGRATVKALRPTLKAALGDNIIPFGNRVWARPSLRLSRSRHLWLPYTLSPASRARRAFLYTEARRGSRYVRPSTPSPMGSADPVVFRDVQTNMAERLSVMAIQGLAVALGFSGLLVLLTLF
jgi:hypothetical protein